MTEIFKVYHKGPRVVWEVSNLGNVKRNGKLYKPKIHNGYLTFTYSTVHRAVAELFIPNPEGKPCVDHIDGNPLNNRVDNLRWVTYSENNLNPITRKRNSETKKIIFLGEGNPMYGKTQTEQSKKKNSDWHREHFKGENHPLYDIPCSDERKEKIRQKMLGKHWKLVNGVREWY